MEQSADCFLGPDRKQPCQENSDWGGRKRLLGRWSHQSNLFVFHVETKLRRKVFRENANKCARETLISVRGHQRAALETIGWLDGWVVLVVWVVGEIFKKRLLWSPLWQGAPLLKWSFFSSKFSSNSLREKSKCFQNSFRIFSRIFRIWGKAVVAPGAGSSPS